MKKEEGSTKPVTLIFLRQHCCSCIQLFYFVFDTMPNKRRSRPQTDPAML
jgi:hypothetical protein